MVFVFILRLRIGMEDPKRLGARDLGTKDQGTYGPRDKGLETRDCGLRTRRTRHFQAENFNLKLR